MDWLLTDVVRDVAVTWWLQCSAAAALIGLFYYYLVLPMDWTKDLCDVGFEPVDAGVLGSSRRARRAVLREAQLKRRVGQLPPVFPNGWFSVLESDRLAAPPAVHHVTALGQNLAVFRGESGTVHVLDAYCPHMGANMAVDGVVRGDCLVCPFHEWQFDGHDGKCTAVPYSQKVPDFAKVRRWDCRERNGLVFVWHHAEGEPPTWEPQPIVGIDDGSWSYVGRNEFLVACHIQQVPENGADAAHLEFVHAPGIGINSLTRHLWDLQWSTGDKPHTAVLKLNHQIELFGMIRFLNIRVEAHQIGPGYVELFVDTDYGPIVIVQSVTPVEPLLQRVIHRMYCPRFLVPYAKVVFIGEAIMFERDIKVWNHMLFEEKPVLVKEDRFISRFRRWYSQFYSENSPKYTSRKETLEW